MIRTIQMKSIRTTILAGLITMALQGCDLMQPETQPKHQHYSFVANEVCFEGVAYIQFRHGVSVAYNRYGNIKLCKE